MKAWITILKMAGALFPASAACVQLLSDMEVSDLEGRLSRLEDPIASLHETAVPACKMLYDKLRSENDAAIRAGRDLSDYRDVLRIFEARGFIQGRHAAGKEYGHGLRITDPSFILYLFHLSEGDIRVKAMIDWFHAKLSGGASSIHGKDLASSLDLPLPVATALFQVHEQNGAGFLSREIGSSVFLPKRQPLE